MWPQLKYEIFKNEVSVLPTYAHFTSEIPFLSPLKWTESVSFSFDRRLALIVRPAAIVLPEKMAFRSGGQMLENASLAYDLGYFEAALRDAVHENSIQPVFQPIVHLRTGEISSFEVLARWRHHCLGHINPSRFIPAAERIGVIGELMSRLIRAACSSALQYDGDFRLAFNISPLHFQEGAMPGLFENAVNASGFPLARTQIEITENAVIDDAEAARATIDQLREKGVRMVLDDFGTGYSSLTRLQALPFDKIKIDASFVRSMCEVRDSRMIVSAVIGLGHSLGMPVVAEGVETVQQADLLISLGCDLGQGWLFGRPVTYKAIPELLQTRGQKPQDILPEDPPINQHLAHLEATYTVAPIGLCFVDTHLRIQRANQRFAQAVACELMPLRGQHIAEIFSDIESQFERDVGRRFSINKAWPVDLRIRHGEATIKATIAPALDENGELQGFSLAVVEDA